MCGRYARRSDKQRIAEAMAAGVPPFEIAPSYNVAPQTFQPVVRLNRDTGEREIVLVRWGLIQFWSKDQKVGYSTINAKAETLTKSAAFREAVVHRRCLVPADAFYEWLSQAVPQSPWIQAALFLDHHLSEILYAPHILSGFPLVIPPAPRRAALSTSRAFLTLSGSRWNPISLIS